MTTFETIKTIIVDIVGCDPEKVTPEARLIEDIGMDSLDALEVLMAVEDELLPACADDEDLEAVKTVSDAVNLADKVRAAA